MPATNIKISIHRKTNDGFYGHAQTSVEADIYSRDPDKWVEETKSVINDLGVMITENTAKLISEASSGTPQKQDEEAPMPKTERFSEEIPNLENTEKSEKPAVNKIKKKRGRPRKEVAICDSDAEDNDWGKIAIIDEQLVIIGGDTKGLDDLIEEHGLAITDEDTKGLNDTMDSPESLKDTYSADMWGEQSTGGQKYLDEDAEVSVDDSADDEDFVQKIS